MDRQNIQQGRGDSLHIRRPGDLSGQTAIVTGAGKGIGRAVAIALAQAGANVAVHYHLSQAAAEATAQRCEQTGVRAVTVRADLTEPGAAEHLVLAASALGAPGILVNNAGMAHSRLFVDTTLEDWQALLNVNLTAPFLCVKAVLPFMLREGAGRIVNIASVWGLVGGSTEVAYSASKGGLLAFTKALAKELGRTGITVNAVAPGAVATDMLQSLSQADLQALIAEIPAGRLGQPADIADAVVYLASPTASYVTGQVLSPSGGWFT